MAVTNHQIRIGADEKVSQTIPTATASGHAINKGQVEAIFVEENLLGDALYNETTTGSVALDCATFSDWYRILTGNTSFTFTNTPASGKTFVRSLIVKSTTAETLSFPTATLVIGEYLADTSENDIAIKFSNFPTVGLKIIVYINQ